MTAIIAGMVGAVVVAIGIIVLVVWRYVVLPRQRRAAAALYTQVQLQILTHAAMAALLDEARRALTEPRRPTS